MACHFGSLSMVRFLLLEGPGVRVDVQNELGYTPLHQAAQQGHSQIVNLLLENNASPNTVSNVSQPNFRDVAKIAKRLMLPTMVSKIVTFSRWTKYECLR